MERRSDTTNQDLNVEYLIWQNRYYDTDGPANSGITVQDLILEYLENDCNIYLKESLDTPGGRSIVSDIFARITPSLQLYNTVNGKQFKLDSILYRFKLRDQPLPKIDIPQEDEDEYYQNFKAINKSKSKSKSKKGIVALNYQLTPSDVVVKGFKNSWTQDKKIVIVQLNNGLFKWNSTENSLATYAANCEYIKDTVPIVESVTGKKKWNRDKNYFEWEIKLRKSDKSLITEWWTKNTVEMNIQFQQNMRKNPIHYAVQKVLNCNTKSNSVQYAIASRHFNCSEKVSISKNSEYAKWINDCKTNFPSKEVLLFLTTLSSKQQIVNIDQFTNEVIDDYNRYSLCDIHKHLGQLWTDSDKNLYFVEDSTKSIKHWELTDEQMNSLFEMIPYAAWMLWTDVDWEYSKIDREALFAGKCEMPSNQVSVEEIKKYGNIPRTEISSAAFETMCHGDISGDCVAETNKELSIIRNNYRNTGGLSAAGNFVKKQSKHVLQEGQMGLFYEPTHYRTGPIKAGVIFGDYRSSDILTTEEADSITAIDGSRSIYMFQTTRPEAADNGVNYYKNTGMFNDLRRIATVMEDGKTILLPKYWVVDGYNSNKSSIFKFVNTVTSKKDAIETQNCRFVRTTYGVWLMAIRDIQRGEEIIIDYGDDRRIMCDLPEDVNDKTIFYEDITTLKNYVNKTILKHNTHKAFTNKSPLIVSSSPSSSASSSSSSSSKMDSLIEAASQGGPMKSSNNSIKGMNQDYNVEKIIDVKEDMDTTTKNRKKVLFYKVRWEGYSDEFNTWEPEYNMTNATDAINSFWEIRYSSVKKSKLDK